ncbi:MAG: hypothetical protein JXB33_06375 [Clostridia bacterium]|nr:hypothetical protein [Clostridia bacterium]
MYTKKLLYTRTVCLCEGPPFSVDYFLTIESCGVFEPVPEYGILIEKREPGSTDVFDAAGCIDSIEEAGRLLKALFDNTVTPVCAPEALEAIIEIQLRDSSI